MNKSLIKLAVHMLDSQDGIDTDTYDKLAASLKEDQSSYGNEIVENVSILQGRAFLNEDWVEEKAEELENI